MDNDAPLIEPSFDSTEGSKAIESILRSSITELDSNGYNNTIFKDSDRNEYLINFTQDSPITVIAEKKIGVLGDGSKEYPFWPTKWTPVNDLRDYSIELANANDGPIYYVSGSLEVGPYVIVVKPNVPKQQAPEA
ncbi:hypothetical protein KC669_01640 [Candidatus Dojkabacteria bacterium]|uniref:Uncharacterized protein n=1 Tax=Candidatus Dojkabacteria bacterium TaxID=2099670 RepID=A0A955LAA9_9BACT|nr:hypothetical protein [Candidatus Dojkabacteria bacterium]